MRFIYGGLPLILLSCVPAVPSVAATLTVQPGQSIQSAVNAANPGDTVVVKGGTYSEQVLIQNNNSGVQLNGLSLVGTSGATLSGVGDEASNGIEVEANNVTVRGFTVQGYSFGFDAGTLNNIQNVCVFGNLLKNNLSTGIFLDTGLSGGDIHDNTITDQGYLPGGSGNNAAGDGIDIGLCTGVHIHNNIIYNNDAVGIGCSSIVLTDNNNQPIVNTANKVDHNFVYGSGAYGIELSGAVGQVVTQNIVCRNNQAGIEVANFTSTCIVNNNLVDGNTLDGVSVDASGNTQCTFTGNIADFNGHDGFDVQYSALAASFGIPPNTGNVFSYDEAHENANYDAEDLDPAGSNVWTHDQFGRTNPSDLGK